MKTGILLINLGTPDSPSVGDVRRYLTQFLNDPFVMDIHPVWRYFLVNFIIVPLRAPKSAKLYGRIWTKDGSPLLIHGKKLKELLQKELTDSYAVELGMRYGNPGIEWAVNNLKHSGVKKIIAIPLYPQYAESSTGSSVHQLKKILKNGKDCEFRIIDKFYDNPDFIGALAQVGKKYRPEEYDHIIFSYHGLPERQIRKLSSYCQLNDWCCSSINEKNAYCYRAACFETTRQLVKKLNISEGKYTVSFQSRLNNKWLKPFTDKVIEEKAREEVKKLLVFAPAFVADCLETLYEIAVEYNEKFRKHGGEKIQMVESLNASEIWVNCLVKMVKEQN